MFPPVPAISAALRCFVVVLSKSVCTAIVSLGHISSVTEAHTPCCIKKVCITFFKGRVVKSDSSPTFVLFITVTIVQSSSPVARSGKAGVILTTQESFFCNLCSICSTSDGMSAWINAKQLGYETPNNELPPHVIVRSSLVIVHPIRFRWVPPIEIAKTLLWAPDGYSFILARCGLHSNTVSGVMAWVFSKSACATAFPVGAIYSWGKCLCKYLYHRSVFLLSDPVGIPQRLYRISHHISLTFFVAWPFFSPA